MSGNGSSSPKRDLASLFDYCYELRIYDPLIRSDQTEAAKACGCYDCPVGRITECITQGGNFGGNLEIEGHNLEGGGIRKRIEEFANRNSQASAGLPEKNCDLQQGDGAEGQRFSPRDGASQFAALVARESLGLCEPANDHMSVKQESRSQTRLSICRGQFPRDRIDRP
jgi:hypothetical protein